MSSAFMAAAYIQVHFKQEFFMEAKTMNPDQTAPKGEVSSGPILFCSIGFLRSLAGDRSRR